MSDPTPDLPQRPVPAPHGAAAGTGRNRDGAELTGDVELTGDPAVDAALADLGALDPGLEPGQQLPVLMAVHEALQQRLSSTEA